MSRRTNNETQFLQDFKAMVNRRYDALERYDIQVKPCIAKKKVIQFLELQDYNRIIPFFDSEKLEPILTYLKETNPLFKKKTSIDKEIRKIFEPGIYTYVEETGSQLGLRKELIDYSNQVISGKIISCKKHKGACKRFLKDLERENTNEFPYIFDESQGDRFLSWAYLFRHTKGSLAGDYIELHTIQKFVFGNVYGWIHRDTKLRRFRKFYWQVARKNAKSQILATVASYELIQFGELGSEIYCAGVKRDQSKIVFNETVTMLERSFFKDEIDTAYGMLRHQKSGSFMRPLSEDDQKTGDGLNSQLSIIDEFQSHPTTKIYDVLESGMLARKQPLIAIITTAGLDLKFPCRTQEYELVTKILDPNIDFDLPEYFTLVNELDCNDEGELIDDIKDPSCWEKANPIAASYQVGRNFIQSRVNAALASPEKLTETLTKTFNVWYDDAPGTFLNMEKWKLCGKKEFPDVREQKVYVGIDLSLRLDLTSVAFIIPQGNETHAVLSHSFMPEEQYKQQKLKGTVPYELWKKEGWLTITPGIEISYHMVLDYILEQYEKYNWKKEDACFDRALASWLRQELSSRGFIDYDIPQNFTSLSEPTKDFKNKIYAGKIIHDNNPLLGWALSNAKIHMGPSGNIMLSKIKSLEKIDPAAALITGYCRAMLFDFEKPSESVYQKRGFLAL